jgi:signal transduction histidine kinase/ActR/RegA family two-component response regulator
MFQWNAKVGHEFIIADALGMRILGLGNGQVAFRFYCANKARDSWNKWIQIQRDEGENLFEDNQCDEIDLIRNQGESIRIDDEQVLKLCDVSADHVTLLINQRKKHLFSLQQSIARLIRHEICPVSHSMNVLVPVTNDEARPLQHSEPSTHVHSNDGYRHDGHKHDGHEHDGHLHDGHQHDGHLHDGHLHDGQLHDGQLHDGQSHDGHWHDGHKKLLPKMRNHATGFAKSSDESSPKEVNPRLMMTNVSAEEANRRKSEFLANISHEMRAPMTAVLGFLEILEREISDSDQIDKLHSIKTNCAHMLALLNDVLDLSKIEANKLNMEQVPVCPGNIVYDVCASLSEQANKKGIKLKCETQSDLPQFVKSDPVRMRQILVNLIGNAIKFTDSGSVHVSIERGNKSDANSLLIFRVTDSGIGIPREYQSKLFEPYTQLGSDVARHSGGTGLGLSICRGLAAAMGGDIRLEYSSNSGSQFTFSLPLDMVDGEKEIGSFIVSLSDEVDFNSQDQWDRSEVSNSENDWPPISGRILVVDDSRDIRFIATRFIEDAGGTVVEASNGQDAIDQIHSAMNNGQPFDLILMDMQMPILNGYEATKQLRDSGIGIPIIALTAHAMKGDREDCLDAGCSDYIPKPLDRMHFVQTISQHLKNEMAGPNKS